MTTLLTRARRPKSDGLATVAITGTPAEAVAKARRLAARVDVTAMSHSRRHNQTGPGGRPVIQIDITYRTPATHRTPAGGGR